MTKRIKRTSVDKGIRKEWWNAIRLNFQNGNLPFQFFKKVSTAFDLAVLPPEIYST